MSNGRLKTDRFCNTNRLAHLSAVEVKFTTESKKAVIFPAFMSQDVPHQVPIPGQVSAAQLQAREKEEEKLIFGSPAARRSIQPLSKCQTCPHVHDCDTHKIHREPRLFCTRTSQFIPVLRQCENQGMRYNLRWGIWYHTVTTQLTLHRDDMPNHWHFAQHQCYFVTKGTMGYWLGHMMDIESWKGERKSPSYNQNGAIPAQLYSLAYHGIFKYNHIKNRWF